MGAEFSDRKKTPHQGVRPGEVLAEIERKPQSWRQPIVVNRKDLITPPRHLDAANRRPSGVKRRRKHDSRQETRCLQPPRGRARRCAGRLFRSNRVFVGASNSGIPRLTRSWASEMSRLRSVPGGLMPRKVDAAVAGLHRRKYGCLNSDGFTSQRTPTVPDNSSHQLRHRIAIGAEDFDKLPNRPVSTTPLILTDDNAGHATACRKSWSDDTDVTQGGSPMRRSFRPTRALRNDCVHLPSTLQET